MIAWILAAVTACVVLAVSGRRGGAATDPHDDRPGSDEQWSELADAMRRYRKHKARRRHHVR